MDDKIFSLLEKMYIEIQYVKGELYKTNQSIVRLEDKMDKNHKALYDGYKQTYEKLTTLENKVDQIDKKVEKQDVEIKVIKGAKS